MSKFEQFKLWSAHNVDLIWLLFCTAAGIAVFAWVASGSTGMSHAEKHDTFNRDLKGCVKTGVVHQANTHQYRVIYKCDAS